MNLRPGDAIVFHGMIGGERGVCLVVEVQPGHSRGLTIFSPWVTVMTNRCKLYSFKGDDPEDVFWSRISERR